MLVSRRTTRASEPRATTTSFRATELVAADRLAAAEDVALERHPRLQRVPARRAGARAPLEIGGLDLREEADLPDVDAEQRHVVLEHGPSGAKERAIATEDHEQVGAGELEVKAVAVGRGGGPVLDAMQRGPGDCLSFSATAGSLVGLKANPSRLTAPLMPRAPGRSRRGDGPSPRAATRAARHAPPAGRAGTRRCRRNSRLPSGPRIGDAIAPPARVPRPARRRRRRGARGRGSRDRGRRRRRTSPRPASNCGFTSGTRSPPARSNVEAIGARTRRSEMNETSTLASETGSGREPVIRVRAFVRSIETTRESRRSASASCPRPTSTA